MAPPPPWSKPRGVEAVIDGWLSSGTVRRCLAAERLIGSSEPDYAPLPDWLGPSFRRALAARGVTELYSHQRQAIDAAVARRHVAIATPTASGKSLCFHLPVLHGLTLDPRASALFLYPTKALSRDQEHALVELVGQAELGLPAAVYDGDTPGDARRLAKERCRIVLTNPDMLHAGILPNHTRWASLFEGLRYVVLDELHTYRGVFGSHMAHVIARLRRLCSFHGSSPTFIGATATIGNPRQHAAKLFGVSPAEVELVERSGAPRASRQFFLYNPPLVNPELGIRASTLKQSVALAADLVRARVPTIVFGPSRNSVEVMLKYLRARVGDVAGSDAIMAYRGGYLPEQRRRIERSLRNGEILCVVATNALELGIDIGDLDAVVCAGYPGSVAGTWQRFGRAGRRGHTSIALLVCSSEPLDQYLARDPEYLLASGAEEARIDPSNLEIVIQHLKCAAFEAPFELHHAGPRPARPEAAAGESYATLDADATRDALDYLAQSGLVHHAGGRYFWAGEAFPASAVSLRNIGWDNFVIVDLDGDRSIAELDWRAAHTMLHEQAIYQHDAEQYQVERLDYENHKAFVRKVKPDYFTTALSYRSVTVIDVTNEAPLGRANTGLGDVKVVEKVTGYKKIRFFTHENAGYGDVHLPEMQMHTTSFWLTLPYALASGSGLGRGALIAGLSGVGRALETVAALALMCDPRDLGQALGDGSDGTEPLQADSAAEFAPTIFLYDSHAGGIGLSPRIFERREELVARTRRLIETCACSTGCPACVGPGAEGSERKRFALEILATLGRTFENSALDVEPSGPRAEPVAREAPAAASGVAGRPGAP